MKVKKNIILSSAAALMLLASTSMAAETNTAKVGLVNFKSVVEKSKLGKQEQANFDALRKQMEGMMEEKEKALQDLSKKLNDVDYMDSLSAEADAELKHQVRTLSQEMAQYQQQYYQILQQANYKIIQNVHEKISEAASKVAKNNGLDMVINEEGTFYINPALDVSEAVIKIMDDNFKPDGVALPGSSAEKESTATPAIPAIPAEAKPANAAPSM